MEEDAAGIVGMRAELFGVAILRSVIVTRRVLSLHTKLVKGKNRVR